MLTLERKENELITITHAGEKLDVYVSLIQGKSVKLSFDGSESFEIWRDEVDESDATTI